MTENPSDLPTLEAYPAFVRMYTRPAVLKGAQFGREGDVCRLLVDRTGLTSLYRAESMVALRRIAVGLNSTRQGSAERLFLLPILPVELERAELSPIQTPGETRCVFANSVHYDVELDEVAALRLWGHLHVREIREARFTKGLMKRVLLLAENEGCTAQIIGPTICDCGASRE